MASIQTKEEVKNKRSRKYVFEHKRTREIEGFEDLKMARTIVLSPTWIAVSDNAKALFKKEKTNLQKLV